MMTAERADEWAREIHREKLKRHPHAPLWVLVLTMARDMEAAGVLDTDDMSTRREKLRTWIAAGRPGLAPSEGALKEIGE